MKYLSRKHIITIMLVLVVLIVMLLLGERFANRSILLKKDLPSRKTGIPTLITGTDRESLIYNQGEMQSQLEEQMQSKNFVIRPGQQKLSYTDALDLYKNSIIQFDTNCQVFKSNKTFGLNNEIMIDNRSPKPNKFAVGSNSIVVGPYDFGFMILKEEGKDISVSCGDMKNVVILIVQ